MTEAGWTRERKLVDELLTFIEATSGRKLKFSTIANLNTGETEDPQDRIAAWLKRHLDADRQMGRVVSCAWKYDDIDDYYETACKNAYCLADGTLKDNEHKYCPYCGGLIQLAQQAQDERGVGDAGN